MRNFYRKERPCYECFMRSIDRFIENHKRYVLKMWKKDFMEYSDKEVMELVYMRKELENTIVPMIIPRETSHNERIITLTGLVVTIVNILLIYFYL